VTFEVNLEPDAFDDIQEAISHYDSILPGLGTKFETELNAKIVILELNPFFQIRYDKVHCLPLNRFPYMIHFTIDEFSKTVSVRAVFPTAADPNRWEERT